MFKTIDSIADDFISNLLEEEKQRGMKMTKGEMRGLHFYLGREIRNYYKLWDKAHPLTKQWFDDNESKSNKHIKGGVDYHPNHPDEVSDKILICIWEKLQELRG